MNSEKLNFYISKFKYIDTANRKHISLKHSRYRMVNKIYSIMLLAMFNARVAEFFFKKKAKSIRSLRIMSNLSRLSE